MSLIRCFLRWLVWLTLCLNSVTRGLGNDTNDVIALIGGTDAVESTRYGAFETFLAIGWPDRTVQIRNLAREGDTAFSQPRDVGYPSLSQQLDSVDASIVWIQFGAAEIIDEEVTLDSWIQSYESLLRSWRRPNRRFFLQLPSEMETPKPPLPDLALLNPRVREFAAALKELAGRSGDRWIAAPLLTDAGNPNPGTRLTVDGWHRNARAQWLTGRAWAQAIGVPILVRDDEIDWNTGRSRAERLEQLRQQIAAKNRLWFDYSRPMNWAFLGGDRMDQPSSRDHRDRSIRWFPKEMEEFLPLLAAAEKKIAEHGKALSAERINVP